MKKYKGFSKMWFLALLLVTFVAGCASDGAEVDPRTLVSISVTPPVASIPVTGNQQYTVTAIYGNGSSSDVTATSVWSPGTAGVTMLTTPGLATGATANVVPVVITATFGGKSGSANLTVNAATSVSFKLTPELASIPVTGTQQYKAIETFSDGHFEDRTELPGTSWVSANVPVGGAAVATLSPSGVGAGVATGMIVGQSNITATFGGKTTTPAARLTVTSAAVLSILVTPATATIPVNGKQQFKAFAILDDGSPPLDVTANPNTTWASVNAPPGGAAVATLSPSGLGAGVATGLIVGQSDITATFSLKTSPAARLTVTAAVVPQLTISTFGIAATAGVRNTGISRINGNAVLDPIAGATCNGVQIDAAGGFGLCGGSPPTISGQVISPLFPDAGVTSAKIKADLLAEFLSITPLSGPPAAGSLGGGINLPAGTTLGAPTGSALVQGDNLFTPGVYQSLTSILVTGDITLDAQGNPNATFVFQSSSTVGTADGAVSPGTHSRILLINGAKASNVSWQAGTSATLGTNSAFNGNILASADITMKTGASSCGRLLAGAFTSGAFVFDTNVVSVPGNVNAPASCQ